MEEEDGARHGGTALAPDGGGADLISALPEDLLLLVLRRLCCARAAARTSLLSRHWRGLWTRLTDFIFRGVALETLPSALDSLARVPELLLLDIRVSEDWRNLPEDWGTETISSEDDKEQHAARVSSLLRAAADLSPAELRFGVPHSVAHRPDLMFHSLTVHLPCFLRATSIELRGLDLLFTQLPAGGHMFPVLETLSLSACHIDVQALLLQCPRLRVLRVRATGCFHDVADITVRSASLQELFVESRDTWTSCIDFDVPALNRLVLSVYVREKLSVSVSAPVVEKVSWKCFYPLGAVAGGLLGVTLQTEGNVLSLKMDCFGFADCFPHTELSLAQEIEQHLLVKDFSVLDLLFTTSGHAFGALLFLLLRTDRIRTATKSLKVSLQLQHIQGKEKARACPVDCPCDEPKSWRSETISLINLEEVEFKVFEGEDDELDILRLIFRCAPMLKKITVRLSDETTSSSDWCTKIDDIFMAYPSVECSVYSSTGLILSSQSGVAT